MGSKAVWNFSENSSVLDVQGFPYWCDTGAGQNENLRNLGLCA